MCMCVNVPFHICGHTRVQMEMCTWGPRLPRGFFLIYFILFVEAESLIWTQRSLTGLVSWGSLPQGLSPPSECWDSRWGCLSAYLAFTWVLGIWTLVLTFGGCALPTERSPQPCARYFASKGLSAQEIVHLKGDGTLAALTSPCFKCMCVVSCDQLKI